MVWLARNNAHILRMQYLNLEDAFSGKNSILAQPAIRLISPNPVTFRMGYAAGYVCFQLTSHWVVKVYSLLLMNTMVNGYAQEGCGCG